jgi:hypothetical protein
VTYSRLAIINVQPSSTRFPVQALASSFLLHVLFVAIILWIGPINWWPAFRSADVQLEEIDVHSDRYVLTMPAMGQKSSGSEGGEGAAGGAPTHSGSQGAPASQAKSVAGLIFKGPQPVISNPAKPDNFLQTIRQPDLPDPPKLTVPVASPNVLKMALVVPSALVKSTLLDPKAKPMKPSRRIPAQTQLADIPEPKLTLRVSGETDTEALGSALSHGTATAKVVPPPAPPKPVTPQAGEDDQNLLVLNAVPAQNLPLRPIPPGELLGAFTVTTDPSVAAKSRSGSSATGGGATSSGDTGNKPGLGGTDGAARLAPGSGGTGSGTGMGPGGSGVGQGGGSGMGNGAGPGSGTTGTGRAATDSGPGAGSGTGPGLILGKGSGSAGSPTGAGGSGAGASPFPEVTIAGMTKPPALPLPRVAAPRQVYGMTIVATSSTGGGLKDFGVFKNETVYTVYMDVNETARALPNWTLQYAMVTVQGDTPKPDAVLVPPYPTNKDIPYMQPEIIARNIGRMIVATGVITKDGKLESLRIVQSPNPLLIGPTLASLAKWTFDAAELNGQPIAVKVLVGIPIAAGMARN